MKRVYPTFAFLLLLASRVIGNSAAVGHAGDEEKDPLVTTIMEKGDTRNLQDGFPTDAPSPSPSLAPSPSPTDSLPTPLPSTPPTPFAPSATPTESLAPTPPPSSVSSLPSVSNLPSPFPTPTPSDPPTPVPSDQPSPFPTPTPSVPPTPVPSDSPTPGGSTPDAPSPFPTPTPSEPPTPVPSDPPTPFPTPTPSDPPTPVPSDPPTPDGPTPDPPSPFPTPTPSDPPTPVPSDPPSPSPTDSPVPTPPSTDPPTSTVPTQDDVCFDYVAEFYPTHFRTWHHYHYDYFGSCDMVFIHNDFLDLHIRTEDRNFWARPASVALRIGDDIIIEVTRSGEIYFNQVLLVSRTLEVVRDSHHLKVTHEGVVLFLPGGFFITMEAFQRAGPFVRVKFPGPHFSHSPFSSGAQIIPILESTVGMSGTWGKFGLIGRDGNLFTNVTDFARDWQVGDTDPSLFRTPRLQDCPINPELPDPPRPDSLKVFAEDLCSYVREGYFAECAFDIIVTSTNQIFLQNPVYNFSMDVSQPARCSAIDPTCACLGGTCIWQCNWITHDCFFGLCTDVNAIVDQLGPELGPQNFEPCGCAVPRPPGTRVIIGGDPHIVTFDGLRFDCQAAGEFTAVTTLEDSGFIVQHRFTRIGSGECSHASVTTGIAVKEDNEPTIQLSTPRGSGVAPGNEQVTVGSSTCRFDFFVDGGIVTVGDKLETGGITVSRLGARIVILYTATDLKVLVDMKFSSSYGCYMNAVIDIPCSYRPDETFIGLLGTPNDDPLDDWVQPNGTVLAPPASEVDSVFRPAYEYCVTNWCVQDSQDSIFTYKTGESFDTISECETGYDDSIEAAVLAARSNPQLTAVCGIDNLPCYVEGVCGSLADAEVYIADQAVVQETQESATGCPEPPPPPPPICFSGLSNAQLDDGTQMRMEDLRIGDRVLVSKDHYERIYSFGHFNTGTMKVEYLQIQTVTSSVLEITPSHLVFVKDNRVIPAGSIKVGDSVVVASGVLDVVVSIDRVLRHGIFAPYTPSGSIVVDGIQASCFATLQGESGLVSLGGYEIPVSYHHLGYTFEAPHRLVCHFWFDLCHRETYNDEGMPHWVDIAMRGYLWLLEQNVMVSGVIFCTLFALLSAIQFVEIMLTRAHVMALVLAITAMAIHKIRSIRFRGRFAAVAHNKHD